jgi:hypothetical protein
MVLFSPSSWTAFHAVDTAVPVLVRDCFQFRLRVEVNSVGSVWSGVIYIVVI